MAALTFETVDAAIKEICAEVGAGAYSIMPRLHQEGWGLEVAGPLGSVSEICLQVIDEIVRREIPLAPLKHCSDLTRQLTATALAA